MSDTRPTVNVASNLPMAVLAYSVDPDADPDKPGATVPAYTASIAGERGVESVGGYGITRGVDAEMFAQWMEANPQYAENIRAVTDEDIEAMADAQSAYGFEVGLEEAAKAGNPEPAAPRPPPSPVAATPQAAVVRPT